VRQAASQSQESSTYYFTHYAKSTSSLRLMAYFWAHSPTSHGDEGQKALCIEVRTSTASVILRNAQQPLLTLETYAIRIMRKVASDTMCSLELEMFYPPCASPIKYQTGSVAGASPTISSRMAVTGHTIARQLHRLHTCYITANNAQIVKYIRSTPIRRPGNKVKSRSPCSKQHLSLSQRSTDCSALLYWHHHGHNRREAANQPERTSYASPLDYLHLMHNTTHITAPIYKSSFSTTPKSLQSLQQPLKETVSFCTTQDPYSSFAIAG
jgi:hypothetical protein